MTLLYTISEVKRLMQDRAAALIVALEHRESTETVMQIVESIRDLGADLRRASQWPNHATQAPTKTGANTGSGEILPK